MKTTDALGSPASSAFWAPITVKNPSVTASRTQQAVSRDSQPEKKNVTAAVMATVGR